MERPVVRNHISLRQAWCASSRQDNAFLLDSTIGAKYRFVTCACLRWGMRIVGVWSRASA
eukprot:scaffold26652_cov18-Tisochrysis_lutea.AAC.1